MARAGNGLFAGGMALLLVACVTLIRRVTRGLAQAFAMTLVIGYSRLALGVHLGVHWPSDVAGGWLMDCEKHGGRKNQCR